MEIRTSKLRRKGVKTVKIGSREKGNRGEGKIREKFKIINSYRLSRKKLGNRSGRARAYSTLKPKPRRVLFGVNRDFLLIRWGSARSFSKKVHLQVPTNPETVQQTEPPGIL